MTTPGSNASTIVASSSTLGIEFNDEHAYARLSRADVARTIETQEGLILDLDTDGAIVGIEVLNFRQPLEP